MKHIYLVASYSTSPRDPKQTRTAGYINNKDNVTWNEKMHITRGIKNKDLANARIILDISTQEVYKNTFADGVTEGKSFMELFEYFYKANPSYVAKALRSLGVSFDTASEDETVNETISETVTADEIVIDTSAQTA